MNVILERWMRNLGRLKFIGAARIQDFQNPSFSLAENIDNGRTVAVDYRFFREHGPIPIDKSIVGGFPSQNRYR